MAQENDLILKILNQLVENDDAMWRAVKALAKDNEEIRGQLMGIDSKVDDIKAMLDKIAGKEVEEDQPEGSPKQLQRNSVIFGAKKSQWF